jgi:AbrB family looped-hinge helix DNA binding protein
MTLVNDKLETLVSKRGQTVVPAAIRRRYSIREGDRLVWVDDGQVIKVIPVPVDPINVLRGRGRGENLLETLLKYRRQEREDES